MFWRKEMLGNFRIAPIIKSGKYIQLKKAFYLNFKKSLLIILSIFIILFQLSKKFDIPVKPLELPDEIIFMSIENIPVTKQGVKRKAPLRPIVPIPVEEPSIPEDLTIEPTELNFDASPPNMPEGDGFFAVTPPRPIADVFPEYPASEKEKGVEGEIELSLLVDEKGKVKNVQVVKNSTNSKICEESALKAAYQTQFIPAKQDKKYVAVWIRKIYKFGLN